MNTADAIRLVDSFRERLRDEALSGEVAYRASLVLTLAHIVERNLAASPELKHGLAFARSFAERNNADIALSRLHCTLVSVGRRERSP